METLSCEFGDFSLARYPKRPRETLRAWDAADEYLLSQVAEEGIQPQAQVLVVNDHFGALASALHGCAVSSWSDSWLARLATLDNAKNNGIASSVNWLPATQPPPKSPDWVLIKVPKTLAFLDYQLCQLRAAIGPQTRVIAAGMVKHIHRSSLALFEQRLGPTTTSLARKKARLIFPELNVDQPLPEPPTASVVEAPDWQLRLQHEANVFSREKLDIGARAMLAELEKLPDAESIVDLGCGNAVLGIVAQRLRPNAEIRFVDESFMALASARKNYQDNLRGEHPPAQFLLGNCLQDLHHFDDANGIGRPAEIAASDVILCNPPFHQQHGVGDQIAQQMFRDSRNALKTGGELWVVGNRHLGYHAQLKRLFGNVEQLGGDRKFVVLKAQKQHI